MALAPFPAQRACAPAQLRALLALLPLLLGGCSGTPFGEALSRSFPGTYGTPAGTATPPFPQPSPPPARAEPHPIPAPQCQARLERPACSQDSRPPQRRARHPQSL